MPAGPSPQAKNSSPECSDRVRAFNAKAALERRTALEQAAADYRRNANPAQ
jgi:hypothetical protein